MILKQERGKRLITAEQFDQQEVELELARLVATNELYRNYGFEKVEIQQQIADLEFALLDAMELKKQEAHKKEEERLVREKEIAEQRIQSYLLTGLVAIDSAENAKSAIGSILNIIRQEIAAKLALLIAKQVAKQMGSFKSLATGGIAGIAASLGAVTLIHKVWQDHVPSFHHGGYTGKGNIGMGSKAGGYIRGVVEEDEYVINREQLRDPYVANFASYLEKNKMGSSALTPLKLETSDLEKASENILVSSEIMSEYIVKLVKYGVQANISNRTIEDMDELRQRRDKTRLRGKT